jgi:hypothetical protein
LKHGRLKNSTFAAVGAEILERLFSLFKANKKAASDFQLQTFLTEWLKFHQKY